MDPELQALSIRLAETVARNTATVIADRIHALRVKKDNANTIAELEQMVSDLIADKSEIVQIAQAYREELVAQQISTDDVTYITTNIVPVIEELIKASAPQGGAAGGQTQEFLDLVRPILSVETITVLQLLGFNFRRAVGHPLTELVSHAITAKMSPSAETAQEVQRLTLLRELAFFEVAKDPEAYSRLNTMTGRQ